MPYLNLSSTFRVPQSIITETLALLGKRGAGKTHNALVLAEELIGQGLPVVIVDPVGVCWGLRASADGRGPGLPIVVMGGEHGDVPLAAESGHVVANLVAVEGVSAVLDLSLMRKGDQKRFVRDFAEELYHKNRRPLHLILDEADEWAPQKPFKGDERMLGSIEDLVRRGRARGIGVTMATQRAAVLNKNVLSQVEILVAMRLIAPQDRAAIDAWVEAKGDPEKRDEVVGSLASLKNGEAWFWSPSFLDIFKRVQVRRRTTFDSSKTPEVGKALRAPKRLAPVDLERIKVRISETIEKAKLEDPRFLRAEVDRLKGELSRAKVTKIPAIPPAAPPPAPVQKVNRIVIRTEGLERLMVRSDRVSERLERLLRAFDGKLQELLKVARAARAAAPAPQVSKSVERRIAAQIGREIRELDRQVPRGPEDDSMVAGERKILEALRRFNPKPLSRNQIGLLVGLPAKGTTFQTYFNRLKRRNFIYETEEGVSISGSGISATPEPTVMANSPSSIREIWSQKLVAGERKILEALIDSHPSGRTRESLGADLGINPGGTTIQTYVNRMKRVGLVVERNRVLFPSEDLFVGA